MTNESKRRRRLRKTAIWLGSLFVAYTIIGFLIVPPIVRSVARKKLARKLGRQVEIQTVRLNPWVLSLTVRGFKVHDKADPETFVGFSELYVNVQPLASLFRFAGIVKQVRIVDPHLRVVRKADGTFNFSDLLAGEEKPKPAAPPKPGPQKPPRFRLTNFEVVNGSLDVVDEVVNKKHAIRDVDFTVPLISTLGKQVDEFVTSQLRAQVNDMLLAVDVKSKPFIAGKETEIEIDVKGLRVPGYASYLPPNVHAKLVSGSFESRLKLTYLDSDEAGPALGVSGDIVVRNLVLNDADAKPFFKLPSLAVDIAPSNVMAKELKIASVRIDRPEVYVRTDAKGTMNVQRLVTPPKQPARNPAPKPAPVAADKKPASPFVLSVAQVRLDAAKVGFSDASRSAPFQTVLFPIDLSVKDFSTEKDHRAKVELRVKTEAKESIETSLQFCLDPLGAQGSFALKGISIPKYAPYYRDKVLFDIRDATLDVGSRYDVSIKDGKQEVRVSDLKVLLDSLVCVARGEKDPFVSIPKVAIEGGSADLAARKAVVARIATEKGVLAVERRKDGTLNLQHLVPAPAVPPAKTPSTTAAATPAKPWDVKLENFALDGYTLRIDDLSTAPRPAHVTVDQIVFKAANISLAEKSKIDLSLSLRINEKGSFRTAGQVGLKPVQAKLDVALKDLNLPDFQPYVPAKMDLFVAGGRFSTAGQVEADLSQKGQLKALFKGGVSLVDLALTDRTGADKFFAMKSLDVTGIDANAQSMSVGIDQIKVSEFSVHGVRDADGKINFQKIMPPPAGDGRRRADGGSGLAAPAPPGSLPPDVAKKLPLKFRLGELLVEKGNVTFVDKSVSPNYSTSIDQIQVSMKGVSSELKEPVLLTVSTTIDKVTDLKIGGRINPNPAHYFADLEGRLKNLDLTPLGPYTQEYIGYRLRKGKLSVKVDYRVEQKQLQCDTQVVLDQFTLGDRVPSPKAVKLPLSLLVGLLKDSHGEIKLPLPVTGRTDDPQFRVGKVMRQTLLNILQKAATSPFTVLAGAVGGIVGDGEKLSYLEFEAGSDTLSAESRKKMDIIVKALSARPGLSLDVSGYVDKALDGEKLRDAVLLRKLKEQKLLTLPAAAREKTPIDQVKIAPSEYERYLMLAFRATPDAVTFDDTNTGRRLSVQQMAYLLRRSATVSEADMRQLAAQRATAAQQYLLASKKIDAAHVFLVKPDSLEPENEKKVAKSRVMFSLK